MNKDKYDGELILQCIRKKTDANDAPWKLTLRADCWSAKTTSTVALASGEKAKKTFDSIYKEWEKSPNLGYKLNIKPYYCDHMIEGDSISIFLEKANNFDIFKDENESTNS